MNSLSVLTFCDKEIRTTLVGEEPWFVGKDICEYFGDTNYRRSLSRLAEDEKGVSPIGTLGGTQKMTIVNESGLYSLLFYMSPEQANLPPELYEHRKTQVSKFRRWVTSEVLPAIRRTGGYIQASKDETPDEIMAKAVLIAQETIKRQSSQIEQMTPKAIFADAVSASPTSILVGEMAKILRQNGVKVGANRFFEWLRENGYLIQRGRTDYNVPTQRAMELGLFEIKETAITHADGRITISKTPKITGKGQLYFSQRFLGRVRK